MSRGSLPGMVNREYIAGGWGSKRDVFLRASSPGRRTWCKRRAHAACARLWYAPI